MYYVIKFIFIYIFFFYNILICESLILKKKNIFFDKYVYNLNVKQNEKLVFDSYNKIVKFLKNDIINKYYFSTSDICDIVGYSGKKINILLCIDFNGCILDVKLISHTEPILINGIKVEKLIEIISFYKNKNIKNKIEIGKKVSNVSIPIIAQATVTSLIVHDLIINNVKYISKLFNIIDEDDICFEELNLDFKTISWCELLNIGAIKNFKVDYNYNVLNKINYSNKLLVDIYIADLTNPLIGKNLLYENDYNNLISNPNLVFILVLNNGDWSFKGSAFVRGGMFDRLRLEQDNNVFCFKDIDYIDLYDLQYIRLNKFKEHGIFKIDNKKFNYAKSWNFIILVDRIIFKFKYNLPNFFYNQSKKIYYNLWFSKINKIIIYLFLWLFVIIIFFFRNIFVKSSIQIIYNLFLIFSILFIILFLESNIPSIVNIFVFIENINNLSIFLLQPFIFISWFMIILTVILWGKSIFCGWICPFGSLQELLFKLKKLFINKNLIISDFMNFFFFKIKYIFLFFLIVVSFIDLNKAEIFAEIEPFKTIWSVGIFNRSYILSFYVFILLFFSFFIYRFFCRYLCPLGSFLSILSYFQYFNFERRKTCKVCKICYKLCNSQAIKKNGEIDNEKCFGCLMCIYAKNNFKLCPALLNVNIWNKYEI